MFNSSPIDAWEGAGAIFNSAGSGGVWEYHDRPERENLFYKNKTKTIDNQF